MRDDTAMPDLILPLDDAVLVPYRGGVEVSTVARVAPRRVHTGGGTYLHPDWPVGAVDAIGLALHPGDPAVMVFGLSTGRGPAGVADDSVCLLVAGDGSHMTVQLT